MNTDLRELYQEIIIDHNRHPCNFKKMDEATAMQTGYNALCGDKIVVYVSVSDGVITDISFQGQGCAISIASASLMTEAVKGKTLKEAQHIFQLFCDGLTKGEAHVISFTKLSVLSQVKKFPMRVKCATLAWHTLISVIDKSLG